MDSVVMRGEKVEPLFFFLQKKNTSWKQVSNGFIWFQHSPSFRPLENTRIWRTQWFLFHLKSHEDLMVLFTQYIPGVQGQALRVKPGSFRQTKRCTENAHVSCTCHIVLPQPCLQLYTLQNQRREETSEQVDNKWQSAYVQYPSGLVSVACISPTFSRPTWMMIPQYFLVSRMTQGIENCLQQKFTTWKLIGRNPDFYLWAKANPFRSACRGTEGNGRGTHKAVHFSFSFSSQNIFFSKSSLLVTRRKTFCQMIPLHKYHAVATH